MDALRSVFEDAGMRLVSSYVASGNVIFESGSTSGSALERKIEGQLLGALGFEVATMIRTDAEVARVALYEPFERSAMDEAAGMNVGFMSNALNGDALAAIDRMQTEIDSLQVNGREVYWMCASMLSASKFSTVRFEKACGTSVTFRTVRTVRKLAALYPP